MPDFARSYVELRGSKGFLWGLVTLVTVWMCLHFLIGLDPDWGMLNLFLSSEASISLAFFTMTSAKQELAAQLRDEAQAKAMMRVLNLVEAILPVAEAQRDLLQDHAEALVEVKGLLHTIHARGNYA